jgi:hypothetical protein
MTKMWRQEKLQWWDLNEEKENQGKCAKIIQGKSNV